MLLQFYQEVQKLAVRGQLGTHQIAFWDVVPYQNIVSLENIDFLASNAAASAAIISSPFLLAPSGN